MVTIQITLDDEIIGVNIHDCADADDEDWRRTEHNDIFHL